MSYNLKAFLSVGSYINNAPGLTAQFCELSDMALTYSKEKGQYSSVDFPGRMVLTFSSKVNDVAAPMPAGYSPHIHRVLNKVLLKSNESGSAEYSRAEFLNQMVIDAGNEAINFDCGMIATDGVRWLPEWLSWTATGLPEASNRITIWLSDEAFRGQYSEYDITVIPPLVNIDNFFQTASQVNLTLQAVTADDQMDRVQDAKSGDPETAIRALTFKYVDPLNATTRISTVWTVLIYGTAGDNPDAIKNALFDYILSHSTQPQSKWEVIFPDIFRRTEFLVLPGWWKLALEQRLPIAGIYSPVLDLNKDVAMLKSWVARNFPEYTGAQLNRAMCATVHNYRSLNLVFIGAVKNRDNKYLISDWFPDYIPVATTSVDFSRMNQSTAQWAVMLTNALIIAETWTSTTTLPANIRRLTRNGLNMLVFTHDNVNYLIYPHSAGAYTA